MNKMILHIVSSNVWQDVRQCGGDYQGDTLATEGFIHCSTASQVIEVADLRFRGRTDLLLLVIDEEKVRAPVKYEDGGNGKLYPHVYGPLNVSAVIEEISFQPKTDGTFELPSSTNIRQ